MLEIRLIIKTLKRQSQIYFVYFIGIISVISLLIMYVNFMSTVMSSSSNVDNLTLMTIMKLSSLGIMILVSFFLLFITMYGNKMMRKVKAKEYGLFKLYGITNRKLFEIIFLEQFLIISISFIISLIIGTFLTFFLVFSSNAFVKEYIPEGFKISLSLSNYLLICILLLLMCCINSIFNYRAVKKHEIVNLLNEENKLKPAAKMTTGEFIFYVINIIILYVLMIFVIHDQLKLINIDELFVIIIIWCFGIYFLYKVGAYIFVKIVPKKVLYKKENLFTYTLINRKMASNVKVMTFITVFLVFLFALIFIGTFIQGYSRLMYQQDDIVLRDRYNIFGGTYEGKDYSFTYYDILKDRDPIFDDQYVDGEYVDHGTYYFISESQINEFLKSNNFKQVDLKAYETIAINPFDSSYETYKVNTKDYGDFDENGIEIGDIYTVKKNITLDLYNDATYLIIPDENIKMTTTYSDLQIKEEILNKYKSNYSAVKVRGFLNGYCIKVPGSTEDEESNCEYTLLESDMNEYFKNANIDIKLDLDYGEFALLGEEDYFGNSLENRTEVFNFSDFGTKKVVGHIVDIEDIYLPQLDSYQRTYIVVSDEQAKEDKYWYGEEEWGSKGYEEEIFLNFEDKEDEQNNAWIKAKSKLSDSYTLIKTIEVKENYMSSLIALSFTMYISFVLLILLICILSLQSAIDSVENKKEFYKLKKINYTTKDLKRSVNKITCMYFMVPFLIAFLNIYLFIIPFINFLSNTRYFSILKYIDFSMAIAVIILLLIIYVSFFILINYAYKKIVKV